MGAVRQTNIASSLPVIGILAIIGGVFYISRSPLETSRPQAPGLKPQAMERGKVDAWLWQDPFKAVQDQRQAKNLEEKNDPCEPSVYQLSGEIDYFIKKDISVLDPNTPLLEILKEKLKLRMSNQRPMHIILTMVRDDITLEDYERRLRNRYAVLTALRASGMAAEDTKHIGYFMAAWPGKDEFEKKVPRINKVCPKGSELQIVPYEWFKREELYPTTHRFKLVEDRSEHVLVVWLPESVFLKHPLTRLAQLIDALGRRWNDNNDNSTPYDWAKELEKKDIIKIDLIGPSRSATLRAMLKEIAKLSSSKDPNFVDVKSKLRGLRIYSPWSTASPALLVDNWPDQDPSTQNSILRAYKVIQQEFEKKIDVKFLRMIGSDDLLVKELINELRRRGVNVFPKDKGGKEHHVALISEWDTFYGKAFPLTFAAMMESIDPHSGEPNWIKYLTNLNRKTPRDDSISFPDNLHTYSYICGIDGILPKSQFSKENQSDEKTQNEKTESESKWAYSKSLELPIGRGQLDYARRLAQKLSNKHKGPYKKLKAVGIVGTDVYDKLILLHALREEFDDVIFFTPDLDARLIHHEQYKWTRNVIVASNFGLQLNEKYQRDVYQPTESSLPPFRDNYQSALFFACRTALGIRLDPDKSGIGNLERFLINSPMQLIGQKGEFNEMLRDDTEKLLEWICHPRLYEIGRNWVVDLSSDDADIHPPRRNLVTCWASSEGIWSLLKTLVPVLLAIVFCILILIQISSGVRKMVSAISLRRLDMAGVAVKLVFVFIILFAAVVIIDHYRPEGEPFSLVTGVSIWPGEALRLVAIILSVYFISKLLYDLRKNEKELCKDFGLRELMTPAPVTFTKWRKSKKGTKRSKSLLVNWLSYRRWNDIYGWKANKTEVYVQRLWKEYLIRGIGWNRFHRLIPMVIAFVYFGIMVMLIFGLPSTPYRGIVSFTVDKVLLFFSVFFMIFLIFFVMDATKLCVRFIHNLKDPTTIWPKELIERFNRNKGKKSKKDDALAEWLDIKFIASHTQAVGKLICYPFIILVIMFVARNPYFDNWGFPISLIVIFLLYLVLALICAMMLRREAEKTRRVALDRLGKELVEATAACNKCRTKHLETMIEEIRSVRQGAYSPFTENPVLYAILTSGGIGLLTLLKFLSLS